MAVNAAEVRVQVEIRDEIVAGSTIKEDIPVVLSLNDKITYTPGTAANKANKSAYYTATLAATTSTLDLTTIACSNGTTGFSHIRDLIVVNKSTTDGRNLAVGGASTNPFFEMFADATDKAVVQAGGRAVFEKPLGTIGFVVDATHKSLKFDSGANTVPFELYIIGD